RSRLATGGQRHWGRLVSALCCCWSLATGEGIVIRIDLSSDALACTRFVVSPLFLMVDLLFHYAHTPHMITRRWRALTTEVLMEKRHLELLAVAAGGYAYAYSPDFLTPEPGAFTDNIEKDLHRVATTGMERVGYEMALTLSGH